MLFSGFNTIFLEYEGFWCGFQTWLFYTCVAACFMTLLPPSINRFLVIYCNKRFSKLTSTTSLIIQVDICCS